MPCLVTKNEYFRFVNRVITVVWGVSYAGEFILRVILVYTLPPAVVLAVSPVVLGGITILTITWTFAYARRAARRGAEMRQQHLAVTAAQEQTQGNSGNTA